MAKHNRSTAQKHPKIAAIETTADNLTSRAGLALFGRYLDNVDLGWFSDRWLGPVRKSNPAVRRMGDRSPQTAVVGPVCFPAGESRRKPGLRSQIAGLLPADALLFSEDQ